MERRQDSPSDERRSIACDDKAVTLEKQIEAQRRLSDLLEPGSLARTKSDAICRDMIETLERLQPKGPRRAGR